MKQALNRKLSARIACILLILHGLIEIVSLFAPHTITENLQFFGGMDKSQIAVNSLSIAYLGTMWGVTRCVSAWGIWKMKTWAIVLGIIVSITTIITALSIIPAGVVDTFLTVPVLALLLYTWYGDESKELG
jgi:hypothetical protein